MSNEQLYKITGEAIRYGGKYSFFAKKCAGLHQEYRVVDHPDNVLPDHDNMRDSKQHRTQISDVIVKVNMLRYYVSKARENAE
jgi:hypothetical protein